MTVIWVADILYIYSELYTLIFSWAKGKVEHFMKYKELNENRILKVNYLYPYKSRTWPWAEIRFFLKINLELTLTCEVGN